MWEKLKKWFSKADEVPTPTTSVPKKPLKTFTDNRLEEEALPGVHFDEDYDLTPDPYHEVEESGEDSLEGFEHMTEEYPVEDEEDNGESFLGTDEWPMPLDDPTSTYSDTFKTDEDDVLVLTTAAKAEALQRSPEAEDSCKKCSHHFAVHSSSRGTCASCLLNEGEVCTGFSS